ncbi:Hsp90 chaperone hsp82 [Entomophthora muscae]|uniref:Hsp90 chaperone hsp82 n=1 Tax=Entomophthora muscae TaxID=34485 RepID=A0ACC2URY6_9FUNG|nr:Hsp90 chaperone hsp82 [Entomophthora muscae]
MTTNTRSIYTIIINGISVVKSNSKVTQEERNNKTQGFKSPGTSSGNKDLEIDVSKEEQVYYLASRSESKNGRCIGPNHTEEDGTTKENYEAAKRCTKIFPGLEIVKIIQLSPFLLQPKPPQETFAFQAEISQLKSKPSLQVFPIPNKENGVLIVCNTGTGITKADLVNNLGKIAKSGTKAFMEALSSGADIFMNGQFDVGFYSTYLIANKVEVITKHNDDKQYIWELASDDFFTTTCNTVNKPLGCSTKMCLYLKKNQLGYLEQKRNKKIIKKNSEFIGYPIQLVIEKKVECKIKDDDEKKKSKKKIKIVKKLKKDTISKVLKEKLALEVIQTETEVSTPKFQSTLEVKFSEETVQEAKTEIAELKEKKLEESPNKISTQPPAF